MVIIIFVWDLLEVSECVVIQSGTSGLELKVLPAVKK